MSDVEPEVIDKEETTFRKRLVQYQGWLTEAWDDLRRAEEAKKAATEQRWRMENAIDQLKANHEKFRRVTGVTS